MSFWKSLLSVILRITISSFIFISLIDAFILANIYGEEVSGAKENYENKKVVILLLGNLSLEEYTNMDNVNTLMESGAVGLVNIRGAVKTDVLSSYASIGSGTRSDAGVEHVEAIEKDGNIIIKNIDALKEYNRNNPYNASVGALGDFLHLGGYKTAVISHPIYDVGGNYPAALIATDSIGLIDSGELLYLGGNRKSYQGVYESFVKHYKTNNLIVVDVGEWERNEHFALSALDGLIGRISGFVDRDNTLLIIHSVFYSQPSAVSGRKLTPIVFNGSGVEKGLLFSHTTRRAGIIGNIDIAPSIASFFGGNLKKSSGEPIKIKETEENVIKLNFICDLTSFNSKSRGIVLKAYVSFQIIILVSSLLFILLGRKSEAVRFLRFTSLFLLACPLTLLIMPLFRIMDIILFFCIAVLINAIITYIINRLARKDSTKVMTIAGATCFVLVVDLLLGGSLNKTSLLGYDAIIGARYYGLGNEYMGVLISTILIFIVPLVQKRYFPRLVGIIILFTTLPVIGFSVYGANVGGTISAVVAFCYTLFYFYRLRFNYKAIVLIALTIIFVVILFALYDIYLSPYKSHLAKALIDIRNNGYFVIRDIIYRKISMNIKLFKWTIWSKVLTASVLVMGVLFIKRKKLICKLLKEYNDFFGAWSAIIVASVIGMLVNDSGVVVAATANIFLVFSILYFVMGEGSDGICSAREDGH